MDYLEGYSHLKSLLGADCANKKQSVLNAISAFHNKGFVHGDLHSRNILFGSTGDVKFIFIDFDWAGKDGEAQYPESLNPQINWHNEVGLHKPI